MFVKRHLGSLVAATGLVLAAWGMGGAANAADPFALTSATFKDGTMMPKKVANKNPQNPNCVGDNVSPQLSWSGTPDGTKSFAFTMVDPEGRGGLGVFHWVAYGIPANVTSFAEGEVSKDDRQICRRQEHPGRRILLRALHAARLAAPLHVHGHRDRSRPEGAAARAYVAGVAGQAQRSCQGRGRTCRPVREAAMS